MPESSDLCTACGKRRWTVICTLDVRGLDGTAHVSTSQFLCDLCYEARANRAVASRLKWIGGSKVE